MMCCEFDRCKTRAASTCSARFGLSDVKIKAMKRKALFVVLGVLGVTSVVAWPTVARWKENARRHAVLNRDLPQSERALRIPTSEMLERALPNGTHKILQQSRKITLFSIEPMPSFGYGKKPFHDHEILGQITLTDPKAKAELLASFYDGLVPSEYDALSMGCFNPRHGIRATHNGKTVDLLICFSCRGIVGYLNDKEIIHTFTTNAPHQKFNEILTAANIPISK